MAVFVTLVFLRLLLPCFGDLLLHSVTGEVGSGNYTYYSLMYEGPITLSLTTKLGDADLYVSQLISKPTYEPETYCLHSATCGIDVIHIPKSFRRPIGIGIYGHTSHESSHYLLEVILRERKGEGGISEVAFADEEEDLEDEYEFDVFLEETYVDLTFEDRVRLRGQSKRKTNFKYSEHEDSKARNEELEDEKREEEPFMWSFIWSLMELIFELFFL